jgi:hypothetical protein
MTQVEPSHATTPASAAQGPGAAMAPRQSGDLGDILERVLDKGIVIAGDIQVNLLDIELLTIRLRLIVASVDTAREIGINWWESDPRLRAGAQDEDENRRLSERVQRLERALGRGGDSDERTLEEENRRLKRRIARLERELQAGKEADD